MSGAGDAIHGHLEHLQVDEDSDELLAALCEAAGATFDVARTVAVGGDDLRPGQALWDAAVAPLALLRWTAQLSGARVPGRRDGESEADYLARVRDAVIHVRGWRRGTPDAIRALARGHLAGARRVTLTERYQDAPWRTLVVTYEPETPAPDLTAADLADPEGAVAGVRLIYRLDPGWSVGQFEVAYEGQTVADAEADFVTIADLEARLPDA